MLNFVWFQLEFKVEHFSLFVYHTSDSDSDSDCFLKEWKHVFPDFYFFLELVTMKVSICKAFM